MVTHTHNINHAWQKSHCNFLSSNNSRTRMYEIEIAGTLSHDIEELVTLTTRYRVKRPWHKWRKNVIRSE